MLILPHHLRAIGGKGGNQALLAALADSFNAHAAGYDVNTPQRIAHFLGQIAHESAGFAAMEERASGAAYEGRAALGNRMLGDGRRYKGRGPLQLTGRSNYRHYGRLLQVPLEAEPHLAARPDIGMRIALAYWHQHRLNDLADHDDILAITRRINGGRNGLADRRARVTLAKAVLAGRPPEAALEDAQRAAALATSRARPAAAIATITAAGAALAPETPLSLHSLALVLLATTALALMLWLRSRAAKRNLSVLQSLIEENAHV